MDANAIIRLLLDKSYPHLGISIRMNVSESGFDSTNKNHKFEQNMNISSLLKVFITNEIFQSKYNNISKNTIKIVLIFT